MESRQAWAEEKKIVSLLALLTSIHNGRLGHLPVYGIRLKRKSSKETNHSVMTAPGVNDASPATCFFRTCNDMYVCPIRHYRKNREQHLTLTYYVMDCLPGWVVERQDYADLRMHVSTVPGIPVNRRTSQPEANPTQEKLG